MSDSISVVVPTRDRPAALARCLGALAAQGAAELDVVVVDDASADRAAVERAIRALPSARLVRGPGRGPAASRNLGVRAAAHDVVCLLDDDCVPEPGWARLLAAACAADRAAAGATVAPPGAAAAVLASQAITNHLLADSRIAATGTVGFAPSCNLAAPRALFASLPFDESFPSAAGEDRDWCARLGGRGAAIAYVPEALVVHRQELGSAAFARQQFRYGEGAARFRSRAGGRSLAGPGFYTGLVRAGFREGPATGAAVLASQALTAAGVLSARAAALRASRSRR